MFYLRDETVVGLVFWNMPPIDDRRDVATEVSRPRRGLCVYPIAGIDKLTFYNITLQN